jgi:hypothetical protein
MSASISTELLWEKFRALQEALEASRSKLRCVSLRCVVPELFLGQPATLVARVTDADAAPLEGVTVTLVASWGWLSLAARALPQQGSAVVARTGPDGVVRITLLPPASASLFPSQQAALEVMLSRLDAAAATPRQALPGLEDLARQYFWEANYEFRQAADLYLQNHGSRQFDLLGGADPLRAWSFFDSAVWVGVAEAESEAASGGPVQALGVLPLRFKDWLGPWLQTCWELLRRNCTLGSDFQEVIRSGREVAPIVNGFSGTVRRYLRDQRGLVGEHLGRKVVEAAVRGYLPSLMDSLPAETKVSLIPTLEMASSLVSTAGPAVVSAVAATRADFHREIGRIDVQVLPGLEKRLGTVETGLVGKADAAALASKTDRAAFDGFREQVNTSLATKLNSITFNAYREETRQRLDAKADAAALGSVRTEFNEALRLKADASALGTMRTEFRDALKLKADATALGTVRTEFNEALRLKADATALGSVRTEFNEALRLKADATALGSVRTEFNEALRLKADASALGAFERRVSDSLSAKLDVAAYQTFSSTVDTRIGKLQGTVGRLKRDAFERFEP